MKMIGNSLIVLFVIKCLTAFIIKQANLIDGVCLLLSVVYLSVLVYNKLPEDHKERIK